MGTGGSYRGGGGLRLGREPDSSPSTSAEDVWNCTSTPPHTCMEWCLFKERSITLLIITFILQVAWPRLLLHACSRMRYTWSRAQRLQKTDFRILSHLHILKRSKLKTEHVCKRIFYRRLTGLYFFVCLWFASILTSGPASKNPGATFSTFPELEEPTLCDIEVKTHVYLLTEPSTKTADVTLTFFASGFRPLPNFCRSSIRTNVPFLMKDLSVARSKV